MLMRISLIVAIIAGLAAGVINFLKVKEKIDIVVTERNTEHANYVKTDAELTTTKSTVLQMNCSERFLSNTPGNKPASVST